MANLNRDMLQAFCIDGHPANIKACTRLDFPRSICVAHTLHLMCSSVMNSFPELRAFVAAQSHLLKVAGSHQMLQAIGEVNFPDLPVLSRWGASLKFVGQLLRVWTDAERVWATFESDSDLHSAVLRGFSQGSVERIQAIVAAELGNMRPHSSSS
jgi:hypothetical protein